MKINVLSYRGNSLTDSRVSSYWEGPRSQPATVGLWLCIWRSTYMHWFWRLKRQDVFCDECCVMYCPILTLFHAILFTKGLLLQNMVYFICKTYMHCSTDSDCIFTWCTCQKWRNKDVQSLCTFHCLLRRNIYQAKCIYDAYQGSWFMMSVVVRHLRNHSPGIESIIAL